MRHTNLITYLAVPAAVITLVSCTGNSDGFTLYRASPLDATMRVHVASFDAIEGAAYNSENCNVAADLFKAQPGTSVKYWCEKGGFRK